MDAQQTKLVSENIGLANFLARLMWEKSKEVLDRDDLRSLAYQGLVAAAMRWRAYGEENGYSEESISSGKFFSVFARKRILGQIMDAMREADHVQRSVRSAHKAILKAGYGQGISIEEISVQTGYPIARIHEVIRSVDNSPVSLEGGMNHNEDSDWSGFEDVGAFNNVDSSAFVNEVTGQLVGAFDRLSLQQQCVLTMRFYLGMELQVIAADLGMSLTPVRETLNEAVLSLHAAMFTAAHDAMG